MSMNTDFLGTAANSFLLVSGGVIAGLIGAEFYLVEGTMTYYNVLQKLTLSLFFLGLLGKFNEHLDSKYVGLVADTSFGVFFIHSYVLTASKIGYQKIMGALPEGNIILYFLLAITILIVCVIVVEIVRKFLGKNSRYIIGS